jgi:hypothetical protein
LSLAVEREVGLEREPRLELTGREHEGTCDQIIGRRERRVREHHEQREQRRAGTPEPATTAHAATLPRSASPTSNRGGLPGLVGLLATTIAGSAGSAASAGIAVSAAIAGIAVSAGCTQQLDEIDNIYYDGDQRALHCAIGIDDAARSELPAIEAAMDRAVARGEVLELYGHKPGVTLGVDKLEAIVAAAVARQLPFVLYSEFAAGRGGGPGVALSLDDNAVEAWDATRPMLRRYGARLTFFISRYQRLRQGVPRRGGAAFDPVDAR